MKTRMHRMGCDRRPALPITRCPAAVFTGLMLLLISTGCSPNPEINRHQAGRSFTIYADVPTPSRPASSLIQHESLEINGVNTPITRFHFPPDAVAAMTAMTQVVPITRDHRLNGIRFQIRSLNGPGVLKALIMSSGNESANFEYPELIRLRPATWKTVVLSHHDFTDTRSRLGRMQDSFLPGEWESIQLLLIPFQETGREQVYEWGPLEAVRQTRRYRFH